ncbi:uncharacterized protein [Rutidosis leptorrhynchoides]|uniref:uncharacterized protein n=1 Tax=Rutidosis leptorrhynchoides TaxID=125765 RepID=UPI003A9A31D5
MDYVTYMYVIYLLLRAGVFYSTFSWLHWIGLILVTSVYLHDVIYITCFVQLMSIISGKFWWIYAVIPAVYKGWGLIKGFLPRGGEGVEEDEKTRKKREKMEKKASRGKFVKAKV